MRANSFAYTAYLVSSALLSVLIAFPVNAISIQLQNPYGIAVDGEDGLIYIADTGNILIKVFNLMGEYQTSFGESGTEEGQLLSPQAIAIDTANNDVYLLDVVVHKVLKFHRSGDSYTFVSSFGAMGTGDGECSFPRDIELGQAGNVYVCDSGNGRILRFSSSGNWLSTITPGVGGTLANPYGIDLDHEGNIYIADTENHRVVKLAPNGTLLMAFGSYGTAAGQFRYPQDVALDLSGNIFVADTDNQRIQKFEPDGTYMSSFGSFAELLSPQKVVIDDDYKLYVVDSNTNEFKIYDVRSFITDMSVEPNPFSPNGDGTEDSTTMHYTIPEPARITITIYDSNNNPVRTLVSDAEKLTADNIEVWDGVDGEGERVREGSYVCKLNAVNAANYHAPQQSITIHVEYPDGRITGTVTDGTDPLEGVMVSDGTRTDIADANGEYAIEEVPDGDYTVSATRDGYAPSSQQVNISGGSEASGVHFVLDYVGFPSISVEPASITFTGAKIEDSSSASLRSGRAKTVSAPAATSAGRRVVVKGEEIPGEYIVTFKAGLLSMQQSTTVSSLGGQILRRGYRTNIALVRVQKDVQKFVNGMATSRMVEYVEPNRRVYALGTPNDPRFSEQWGIQRIGAPAAWDLETGDDSILLAIIDSGVDYTHPDIAPNYVPGGYDFVDDDNDPYPTPDGIDNDGDFLIDEGISHGTHCAGIAAAKTDNGIGIAGVAQVKVLAERVLDSDGGGTAFDVANSINHAVVQGANVISMSIGGGGTAFEQAACQDAWDAGCLLVGAAGNDYRGPVNCPAAYPTVIAVSATNSDDQLASFSNIGQEVELAAPGVAILSAVKGGGYQSWQGTSMATPFVAGVAALMYSKNPTLTNSEVRALLQTTATDLGVPGQDVEFGYGLVNAHAAVLDDGLELPQTLAIYNEGEADLEVSSITRSASWLFVSETSFTVASGTAKELTLAINIAPLSPGTYSDTLEIRSNDPDNHVLSIPVTLNLTGEAPAAATNFRAVDTPGDQGSSISLSWVKSADDGVGQNNVVEYRVYRSTAPGVYGEPHDVIEAGRESYVDTNSISSGMYYYKIGAFNGAEALSEENRAWAADNSLPGNLDADHYVFLADLERMASMWQWDPSDPEWDPLVDLDRDDRIFLGDLEILAENWQQGTPPASKHVAEGGTNRAAQVVLEGKWVDNHLLVDIKASNAVSLMGYALIVEYDVDRLSFIEARQGNFLMKNGASAPVFLSLPNTSGKINFAHVIAGAKETSVVSGEGLLINLKFRPNGSQSIRNGQVRTTDVFLLDIERRLTRISDADLRMTPRTFALRQNHPNPFNPSTMIPFDLPKAEHVTLGIYNVLGQKVTTLISKKMEAGCYDIRWDGNDASGKAVSSGLYFYAIKAGKYHAAKKMLVLK